jgi:hypothetical protein
MCVSDRLGPDPAAGALLFSISDGVLTDQLNQVTFCNNTQQVAGTCGA